MRRRVPKILVTGGAGFMGSEFVRMLISQGLSPKGTIPEVIIIDKLTYAGDLARLKEVEGKYKFYKADIGSQEQVRLIFKKEKPGAVINFAAESHVDRSILGSGEFIRTNIQGTQILFDAAKECGIDKVIHVSTDEIYGDITRGKFFEDAPFNPSSPYSASKAAADLLAKSYLRTFKFPVIIVRPSNNYGPWQYPEKFMPVVIYKALGNEKIPVYGRGQNVREWLHVSDCADAILKVLEKGKVGEIYNIGSGNERKNIDVAKQILDILRKPYSLLEYVADRPGHDLRYALNFSKIRSELNWNPRIAFNDGLEETVGWYKDNFSWLKKKVKYLQDYWKKVYK